MPTPPPADEFYLTDSARRHGFDEQDVADVFLGRRLVLRSRRGFPDVYEILGRNRSGAYLLIVARVVEYEMMKRWCVFHVSRMTDADKRLFRRHAER